MLAQLTDGDKALIATLFIATITPTWMSWWNARIARKQVTPNGGTSMKDMVTRIETKVDTLSAVQELHTAEIITIKSRLSKPASFRERQINKQD